MGSIVTTTGDIICPRCETPNNLLSYTTLQIAEGKYANQCAQIIKCPICRFCFAPVGFTFYRDFIETQEDLK